MALIESFHISRLAVFLLVAFVAYHVILKLRLTQKRRALARERGCLPAAKFPQQERLLGWSLFRENIRLFKQQNFLPISYKRFQDMGVNTYHVVALGRGVFITTEPEILKTIQAIEFKKWGLGTRRKIGFRPLLGDGNSLCTRCM